MIEKWTLRNFKSVYDETTLDFAPLTIFCGANSSGKSTLIQSLLLTAQTVQSPVYSRSVVLNGHIVRLGTFDDVISNARQNEQVKIGFRLKLTDSERAAPSSYVFAPHFRSAAHAGSPLQSVECDFSFGAGRNSQQARDELRLQPRLESSTIVVHAETDEESLVDTVSIERSTKPFIARIAELKLSQSAAAEIEPGALEFDVTKPVTLSGLRRYYRLPATMRAAGATLQHFLPERIWGVYDAVQEQTRRLFESLIDRDELRRGALSQNDLARLFTPSVKAIVVTQLRDVIETSSAQSPGAVYVTRRHGEFAAAVERLAANFSQETLARCYEEAGPFRRLITERLSSVAEELKQAIQQDRGVEYRLAASPLPDVAEAGVEYVNRYFRRLVKYLGPLRDEPKPVYPLAGATDPKDVGYRGEHTAAVLELHRNTSVDYIASEEFSNEGSALDVSRRSLHEAVLDWLRYMGVVNDVRTEERASLGHELKVATANGGNLHDLTHVGVGVSQVLPIVVLSLLAESGSLLIFEQPELHLHPRVQTRLADFFVSMTLLNKQCVVETHSEYLINQLRYRTAVSAGDTISRKIIIYFVSKNGQSSRYQTIRMNGFGAIPDWPKGFFDENEESAARILRAAMVKRKLPKDSRHG